MRIKPNLSEDKLADELYKIKYDFDRELSTENSMLLKELNNDLISKQEYVDRFQMQVQKIVDSNAAVLTEYVAHRKVILDLLEYAIRKIKTNRYMEEKYIHDLIFPMCSTSDEQSYDSHNLGLLDEKFAYCTYISSDVPFANNPQEERPDLLILDQPVAMSENQNDGSIFNSIIIFELKRPMRKDYTYGDNSISQLYKYVDKIKTGNAKHKNGRPIRVTETT